MKNQLRSKLLQHKPIWAVMKAEADLLALGYSNVKTSTDVILIEQLADRAQYYVDAARECPYAQPDDTRPAVRPPSLIPNGVITASSSILCEVENVGTLRGLHLVADARGGYSLTLKISLPHGQRVYRYGRLRRADELEAVIIRWLSKGYWTPDKQ